MATKNFYAIEAGGKKCIVRTWGECQKIRDAHPKGARYKGFATIEEAEDFLGSLPKSEGQSANAPKIAGDAAIAYTDGSFNRLYGIWGYGVVLFSQDSPADRMMYMGSGNDAISTRNVAGEVHGAMRAIHEAISLGFDHLEIHYDYEGVEAWATGRWKRNIELTREYHSFVQAAREKITVSFVKVAAHTGNELNEMVDGLAKKAAKLC